MRKKNKLKKITLAKALDALSGKSCSDCTMKYGCFHSHKSVKTRDNMIVCSNYTTERIRIDSSGGYSMMFTYNV